MYDRYNPSIFSVPPSPHNALLSFLSPPTDVENCDGDRKSHGLPEKKGRQQMREMKSRCRVVFPCIFFSSILHHTRLKRHNALLHSPTITTAHLPKVPTTFFSTHFLFFLKWHRHTRPLLPHINSSLHTPRPYTFSHFSAFFKKYLSFFSTFSTCKKIFLARCVSYPGALGLKPGLGMLFVAVFFKKK